MATYTELFRLLEQDPEHAAARRDALLARAHAALWASTTENSLDDEALVIFALIRRALDTARRLRSVAADNEEEVARLNFLLAQALEVQNHALLRWCDSQGFPPSDPPQIGSISKKSVGSRALRERFRFRFGLPKPAGKG